MILEFKSIRDIHNPYFLREKYVEKGWSARQIALEVAPSHSTVIFNLKRFGIPRREEDIPPQGGRAFGKRVVKRQEIPNKRELVTIEKMKELRNAGYSYHKIADILNALGFKTKTGKARWHATTVMKILKRLQKSKKDSN